MVIPAGQRPSGEFIDDTLRARAHESGLLARYPRAGDFPRQRVEVVRGADAAAELGERFYRRGWTDGLPVVPPTLGRVEELVLASGLGREDSLGAVAPLGGLATVEKVAANAAMAGCEALHFPVVVEAVRAILDPAFNLGGVQTTDENVAPLLVLAGPAVRALDLNTGFGMLGPGCRANAVIGRAVRLVMQNVGGGWPGAVSYAGLGQPGRYTLCIGEDAAANPWEPLQSELGFRPDDSVLVAMRAESAINVTGGLVEIASVIGSSASLFGLLYDGRAAVVLAPATARALAAAGWSKADVKRRLFEQGCIPTSLWRECWLNRQAVSAARWPERVREGSRRDAIPVFRSPEDLTLVVAGGDVPIAQHAYFPSWGFPPCRVVRPLGRSSAPDPGAAGAAPATW